jgi:hypothetical protein
LADQGAVGGQPLSSSPRLFRRYPSALPRLEEGGDRWEYFWREGNVDFGVAPLADRDPRERGEPPGHELAAGVSAEQLATENEDVAVLAWDLLVPEAVGPGLVGGGLVEGDLVDVAVRFLQVDH